MKSQKSNWENWESFQKNTHNSNHKQATKNFTPQQHKHRVNPKEQNNVTDTYTATMNHQ